METKILNKNSFAYRFISYPNKYWYNPPETICEYRTALVLRSILVLFLSTFVSLVVFSVSSYILYLFQCFPFNVAICEMSIFAISGKLIIMVSSTIIGTFFSILFFAWVIEKVRQIKSRSVINRMKLDLPPKTPSTLILMFKSWKDKVCYKIDFQ